MHLKKKQSKTKSRHSRDFFENMMSTWRKSVGERRFISKLLLNMTTASVGCWEDTFPRSKSPASQLDPAFTSGRRGKMLCELACTDSGTSDCGIQGKSRDFKRWSFLHSANSLPHRPKTHAYTRNGQECDEGLWMSFSSPDKYGEKFYKVWQSF